MVGTVYVQFAKKFREKNIERKIRRNLEINARDPMKNIGKVELPDNWHMKKVFRQRDEPLFKKERGCISRIHMSKKRKRLTIENMFMTKKSFGQIWHFLKLFNPVNWLSLINAKFATKKKSLMATIQIIPNPFKCCGFVENAILVYTKP